MTITHNGVPVAVVPASSTRDMEEEIAYYRDDGVTEASDIFDKVLAAAPSEPGADLVELIGALRRFVESDERARADMVADGGEEYAGALESGWPELVAGRAALAKWEISND